MYPMCRESVVFCLFAYGVHGLLGTMATGSLVNERVNLPAPLGPEDYHTCLYLHSSRGASNVCMCLYMCLDHSVSFQT